MDTKVRNCGKGAERGRLALFYSCSILTKKRSELSTFNLNETKLNGNSVSENNQNQIFYLYWISLLNYWRIFKNLYRLKILMINIEKINHFIKYVILKLWWRRSGYRLTLTSVNQSISFSRRFLGSRKFFCFLVPWKNRKNK